MPTGAQLASVEGADLDWPKKKFMALPVQRGQLSLSSHSRYKPICPFQILIGRVFFLVTKIRKTNHQIWIAEFTNSCPMQTFCLSGKEPGIKAATLQVLSTTLADERIPPWFDYEILSTTLAFERIPPWSDIEMILLHRMVNFHS